MTIDGIGNLVGCHAAISLYHHIYYVVFYLHPLFICFSIHAIKMCIRDRKTGVSQDGRSEQKMIDFINEYEYEAEEDVYKRQAENGEQ